MLKKVLTRACVSAASVLLALALAEAGWRLWYTTGFGPTTNPHYVLHDPVLGWRYKSGITVQHKTPDFSTTIHINSRGERGVEPDPARPEPVWLAGDSLAFGWGVDEDRALAAKLESFCNIKIRNLAVSGYATDQQYLQLKSRLSDAAATGVAPRTVIMVVCANDVEEVLRPFVYGRRKPQFLIAGGFTGPSSVPGAEPWIDRISFLYRSLRKRLDDAARPPITGDEVARGRRIVVELIRSVSRETSAVGAGLLVVHASETWLAECNEAALGIRVVDASPALQEARREGPVQFAGDPHWNERGHAAVARMLAGMIPK